jgi:hypothetical protein
MDGAASIPGGSVAGWLRQGERLAGLAGILFILVSICGAYFEFNAPDANNTLKTATTAFTTGRGAMTHAAILFVISIPLLLIFLSGLYTVLRRLETAQSRTTTLADLAFLSGVANTTLAIAFIAIYGSLATLILDDVDASVGLALLRLANALDIATGLFIGVMLITASLITWQTAAFPRWISWVGIISGLSQYGGLFTFGTDGFSAIADLAGFIGFLTYIVWQLAIGIAFLRRAPIRPTAM